MSVYYALWCNTYFFIKKFNHNLTFCFVFLVEEGRGDPNITKSKPSSARQQNAIKWRFAGEPLMAKNCLLAWQLCDFSGDPDQIC